MRVAAWLDANVPMRRFRPLLAILFGLVALLTAMTIDVRTANWVHARNFSPLLRSSTLAKIIKSPGDFRFTLAIAAAILFCGLKRWRDAVELLTAGVLAGLFYTLVKWSVGRTRPFPRNGPEVPAFIFHPFRRGVEGLWKADNQAFPSGHACLAFATAAVLARFYPRGSIAFFMGATAVGLERILEGAHYPSDVAGGLLFGVLAALLAMKIVRKAFPVPPEPHGFPVVEQPPKEE